MNNRANAMIGFVVAGGVLVVLAGPAPDLALGIAGLLALGVVLTHSDEVTQLLGLFQSALKPL